jgi:hypothetical protein
MRSQIVRPQGSSANIFINYRREDSSGHAGRLFDVLSNHFAGRLFMDIDTLEPGVDFVDAIEQAVGSCEVLIVVIGREWLTIKNAAGQRRLDDPADFVRLEVESALARKIRVIPVLVQDAPMPRADELPPSLARLARRNAIELSDARWAYDVDRLVRTIQEILEESETAAQAAAAAPGPAALPQTLVAPAAAAKTMGPRVWLLSLAALVLVAAGVLGSVLWMRRAPSGDPEPAQARQIKFEGEVAVGSIATVGNPARVEPVANPAPEATPSAPKRADDTPARQPVRVPPVFKPSQQPVTVPLDVEPPAPSKVEEPAPRVEDAVAVVTAQPPRVTITSPGRGETVGSSVQVQGAILGLGDRRAFLCIRQKDSALYPRGEIFPEADGRWSIQLRSSKEKTFGILVVTVANKDAAQMLSDQRSRDNGLPVLPPGASISSDVVAVKRQGKLSGILNPKD